MNHSRIAQLVVISTLCTVGGPLAHAEQSNPGDKTPIVEIGTEVRLKVKQSPLFSILLFGILPRGRKDIHGTLASFDATSFVIATKKDLRVTVPRSSEANLEISTGRRIHAWRVPVGAAAFGLLAAGAAAYGGGSCLGCDPKKLEEENRRLTFISAGIGALLGLIPHQTWTSVKLPAAGDAVSLGADRTAPFGPPAPLASAPAHVPPGPRQGADVGAGASALGLHMGGRVRVRHGGGFSEGNLLALDETTLTLASQDGVLPISTSAIVAVDSWSGERRRTVKGALIGAAVVGVGDFTGKPECVGYVANADCTRAKSVTIGAGSGAVVGAVIGALLKQSRWQPVSWPRTGSASLEPVGSRLAWGVAPTLARKGGGLSLLLSW